RMNRTRFRSSGRRSTTTTPRRTAVGPSFTGGFKGRTPKGGLRSRFVSLYVYVIWSRISATTRGDWPPRLGRQATCYGVLTGFCSRWDSCRLSGTAALSGASAGKPYPIKRGQRDTSQVG